MTQNELARVIDHTILKAEATEADIRRVVAEAVAQRFASVCVNGRWVRLVADLLRESGVGPEQAEEAVLTCAVVGFPLGAGVSAVKAIEATVAAKDGAREIDMVIALAALLGGDLEGARADVFEVVRAARAVRSTNKVKAILETAVLSEEQVALGCQAAIQGGADFVKTSTGFHAKGGATVQAVQWLAKYAKPAGLKVKASGGIRDLAMAQAMLAAGADRLGTSNSVGIVGGLPR